MVENNWSPQITIFQCMYSIYSDRDENWLNIESAHKNIKVISMPCSGRINPLFVLNALQTQTDGILIIGCLKDQCHFKKGNINAFYKLNEFRNLLSYIGLNEKRIRFLWLGISEYGKIKSELTDFENVLTNLGPNKILNTSNFHMENANECNCKL